MEEAEHSVGSYDALFWEAQQYAAPATSGTPAAAGNAPVVRVTSENLGFRDGSEI